MLPPQEFFAQMRDLLSARYLEDTSAKRVAFDAKLNLADVQYSSRPADNWQGILEAAERQGRVDALLGVVLKTYPGWGELTALREQYRAWVQADRPGGSPFSATPAELPRNLLRLPRPVVDFTGREDDIRTLVAALCGEGPAAAAAAISGIRGMGGLGKTELALKVAEAISQDYPDAGLMFELQPGNVPLTPETLLGQVIHAFHPEARLPDDLPTLQALYRESLAGQRGVLLLDNPADARQVRPLLPPPAG